MSETEQVAGEQGLYERVLSEPTSRDAFFNTTTAQLFANPDDPDTSGILESLSDSAIAHLYSPDPHILRPVLQTEFGQVVGKQAIERVIMQLSHSPETKHVA